jgi:hypothetical protein
MSARKKHGDHSVRDAVLSSMMGTVRTFALEANMASREPQPALVGKPQSHLVWSSSRNSS